MRTRLWPMFALLLSLLLVSPMRAQSTSNIYAATLGESGAKTPEISTEELRSILANRSAMVFDVRPGMEFATGHIPGAVNVAQKPGTSKALYVSDVAEIGRLLGNDKAKPVVVYCKRVSEDLLAAGFTNVRRYQLGIPVWRALGGVTQIEADGTRYVMRNDQSAVWLDTRAVTEIA